MRLADFIEAHIDSILGEWEAHARESGIASEAMDAAAFRDHARGILETIVSDLRTSQTAAEREAKAAGTGGRPDRPKGDATSAQIHGGGRAESGFSVGGLVSEYRALRASVIKLWSIEKQGLKTDDIDELIRFNESIDQALGESVVRFAREVDHSRELFIAVLGHDLRSPLDAVIMGSQFMEEHGDLAEPGRSVADSILRSALRMSKMLDDLLTFARGRFGARVPIARSALDLGTVVADAVEEVRAAHKGRELHIATKGDLTGQWDGARIQQVLSNLLRNALQHADPKHPVTVRAEANESEVVLCVHNDGPPIPDAEIPRIFDPFRRVEAAERGSAHPGSLGLGLYIVDRIVSAHGGTIDVTSSAEEGTTFTVRLPR